MDSSAPAWYFGPGEYQGFNNAGQDIFAGSLVTGLVRETIQNSIDARYNQDQPVRVHFVLSQLSDFDATEIRGLLPNINECLAHALETNQDKAKTFLVNAQTILQSSGMINILSIHDSGTTGLIGDTTSMGDDGSSKWFACVRANGMTAKDSQVAGGSFGHGKNAAWAFGRLSTVFYSTEIINAQGSLEQRMLGRTSLCSTPLTGADLAGGEEFRSDVGYFGHKKQPLLGHAIPGWATEYRRSNDLGTGTSLIIPAPVLPNGDNPTVDLHNQIKLAILANFYVAIKRGILEVTIEVSGPAAEEITSQNLQSTFDEFLSTIETIFPASENEGTVTSENALAELTGSTTAHRPDLTGVIESPNFGPFEWSLRIAEDLGKNVSFARSTGMLITREKRTGLKTFPGCKAFDMFVTVVGDEGSRTLRSMENPEHNRLELDRITDPEQRAVATSKFRKFVAEVRAIILDHAQADVAETELDDALSEFFSIPNEESTFEEGSKELSGRLVVSDTKVRDEKKAQPQLDEEAGSGLKGPGSGFTGGEGEIKDPGGPNPNSDGKGETTQPFKYFDALRPLAERIKNSDEAQVSFDIEESGEYFLRIMIMGDTQKAGIPFSIDGLPSAMEHSLGAIQGPRRVSARVAFQPGDLRYAIAPLLRRVAINATL